jgi:hypothetical protein
MDSQEKWAKLLDQVRQGFWPGSCSNAGRIARGVQAHRAMLAFAPRSIP